MSKRRARSDTQDTGASLALVSATAANGAAGTLFSWSVLLPAVGSEFDVSRSTAGTVFSTALVAFATAVLLGGRAVDRQGPRRVTALAGLLAGAGLLAAASAGHLVVVHLGVGVFGSGSGLAYLSAVSWAVTRSGRRGRWDLSLVVAAYAAGPVVAAPLAAISVDRLGWRATLAIAAVTIAGVQLLASRGLPGAPPGRPGRDATSVSDGVGDARALWTLWVVGFASFVPGLFAFAYAAPIVVSTGASASTAGVLVALMAVGNVLGRLTAAPVMALLGPIGGLWLSTGALLVALLVLAGLRGVTAVAVGLPLLGVQYGVVSALLPAATALVAEKDRFASAYGRVFTCWGGAGILGPSLPGAFGGYDRAFWASLVAVAVAGSALLVLRRRGTTPGPARGAAGGRAPSG